MVRDFFVYLNKFPTAEVLVKIPAVLDALKRITAGPGLFRVLC
jgi:hypothetical protein